MLLAWQSSSKRRICSAVKWFFHVTNFPLAQKRSIGFSVYSCVPRVVGSLVFTHGVETALFNSLKNHLVRNFLPAQEFYSTAKNTRKALRGKGRKIKIQKSMTAGVEVLLLCMFLTFPKLSCTTAYSCEQSCISICLLFVLSGVSYCWHGVTFFFNKILVIYH